MNFIYISHHFAEREDMNSTNWPLSQCVASQLSLVSRAWHRYRGGHRFESRWSPDIFQASSFQLLKLENLLRWSLFTFIYNSSTIIKNFIYTYFTLIVLLLLLLSFNDSYDDFYSIIIIIIIIVHTFAICCQDDSNSSVLAGQCDCKVNTMGRQCNMCKHGFYDLQASHEAGCIPCKLIISYSFFPAVVIFFLLLL